MTDFETTYLYKPSIGSSHTWAIKQLELLPPGAKVLDFGAGSGIMGEKLRRFGQSEIFAVEIDDKRRLELQKTYQLCTSTIEELNVTNFDCILLLDILEHLTNPFEFLSKLSERLTPGGVMLISVPNIAHWSIRFGLLLGFFEYTERGLLDKTHYSFFNKRRALKLPNVRSELALLDYRVSVSPAEFVLPEFLTANQFYKYLDRCRLGLANIFPGILGYQHLLKIQKLS